MNHRYLRLLQTMHLRAILWITLNFFFFCTTPAAVRADSNLATITASGSASTVQVAEPLTLELTVVAPVGSTVDFSSVGDSLGNFDVIDVVDRADVPAANDVNQRSWTRRLTLESIVTGDLQIPALEINVRRNGESQTLKSEVIPIRVTSVLEDRADPTKFRDIHSVVDVPVPQSAANVWLWWALGGCGGLAAVAALLMAFSKRRTWMTPKAWAIRELGQLRNSNAMQATDSERVTEKLTSILRDYLELQFDFSAPVQTTKELLQELDNGKYMDAATASRFAQLFENSDLARFAGVQLTQAELSSAIDDAQRLIEQTSSERRSTIPTTETAEVC